ncbi:MAG: hypothetical protein KDJ34_09405 [Candidatus Competibacteraceae bacterium]|nr:hypothetical protein [Candidatus Competibacteraceae bacterium]
MRALTWIGLVLGVLLLGGGLIHIGLSNTLLIARNPNALWSEVEVLHGVDRLLALWPFVLGGILISAIPAWLYITGEFLRRYGEDQEDREDREMGAVERVLPDGMLEKALQDAQERARDAQMDLVRVTQSLREKDAQIAAQAAETEQRVFRVQQEAARQVKTAQGQAARAARRAQNTAYAYERLKRKLEASAPARRKDAL